MERRERREREGREKKTGVKSWMQIFEGKRTNSLKFIYIYIYTYIYI